MRDRQEQGQGVIITLRGKAVARLVPVKRETEGDAHAAIRRICERAEALKLGRFEWAAFKGYRDDGRP